MELRLERQSAVVIAQAEAWRTFMVIHGSAGHLGAPIDRLIPASRFGAPSVREHPSPVLPCPVTAESERDSSAWGESAGAATAPGCRRGDYGLPDRRHRTSSCPIQ